MNQVQHLLNECQGSRLAMATTIEEMSQCQFDELHRQLEIAARKWELEERNKIADKCLECGKHFTEVQRDDAFTAFCVDCSPF